MTTQGIFLEPGDEELARAWGLFADPGMHNEEFGESLQYMGTWQLAGGWTHQFRHRAIPGTNERKYWNIPVSAKWRAA